MNCEEVLVSEQDAVVTIKINREDKKNALTGAMYSAMATALVEAEQNDQARMVQFVGGAESYCAGNDLKDFVEHPPLGNDAPVWQFLQALSSFSKPIIVGVNGPAVGIGTTMLLHCDLVVASSGAVFTTPFTSLGLCPEAGSSLLMPMQMGLKKSAEWLLLGDRFNAEQACEAGVINKVVADAEAVEEQLAAWRKKILRLSPEAIKVSRRLLRQGVTSELQSRIKEEGDHFVELLQSDDAKAAFDAFLNKK
ncbi:enoyl-CoA hydratase [Pleionea sp. CnH1-48]|uniref:enoyl-CoA hydratase n=1 Tax=Pleionea sp. CnH1-48 TaxID=2954494 RepID=UPI0020981CAA|nr:enoyl-CoA hydratase [Pleionea sp. CnH1-48]MCO7227228.1 enoyl-CoA hydratase [Pleionea sp. CnH1-48]